ncbi:MAG: hypothetical protein A2V98_23055 [Planctomycetes bacterium RBG_16_64_12]|nr:MAG: hypothetical protein A2V98_23055 [Planctomycetes bacterium RBG_16_64_12]
MARKVLNRKELRQGNEAAERREAADQETDGQATPKKAPARRSRAKAAKEAAPLKAFWGVFNQSLKSVALFEYSQRKEADKRAEELGQSGKSPHFVQLVKK